MAELLWGDVSGSAASLATSYADVAGVSVPTASVRRVPTPADQLRALIARATADEPGRSGGRLRAAMAGESPARFRDRLLLERAAHLVATTDRPLRDIAAECGFRRYDVFTRAFRRELGALPSQWRADPTSHAIDCPGDVHFHPPDGLRIPARRSDPGDLVVAMAEQHVHLVGALVHRGADVGVLLDRMEAFVALATDVPPAPGRAPRSRFADARVAYVDAVALVTATGRLDETYVDAFVEEPTLLSLGDMVARDVMDTDGLRAAADDRTS
ncbi:MAG TPA: helix-turn-helix domain-containing protein [Nocardioides sp.]|nr:helix-turn-helix domain-containing protein [Nocardioides sp.]